MIYYFVFRAGKHNILLLAGEQEVAKKRSRRNEEIKKQA
jgi:hypothetical protein